MLLTGHRLIPILVVAGDAIALAALCALCLLKPELLVSYGQRRFLKSKLLQKWPLSNIVFKPWYPTYLRFIGLFGLLAVFLWLYAIVVVLSK
jgi:hypothetical protein